MIRAQSPCRCPLKLILMFVGLACLLTTAATARAVRAAEPSPKPRSAIIQLSNDDFSAGRLVDSPEPEGFLWQTPGFADPFRFPVNAVQSIHFPAPDVLPQAVGEYCFELADEDMLFGSLVSLEEKSAVLDVPGLGQLHVNREILRRMYRLSKSELTYFGPNGLDNWLTVGKTPPWREDAGQLIGDKDGATIRGDFNAPPVARFELELSWTSKPDFELAFGVGSDSKTVARAFRFEVWDDELVALRETEREADIAPLRKIKSGAGRISLQVFLDQPTGRLLVFTSNGEQLADLTVATARPQSLGSLQITNRHGDLRLESLRIGRWNGEPPRIVAGDKARILRMDGTIVYGQLNSYDAAQRQFVVDVAASRSKVAENQIQDVIFAQNGDVKPRSFRAVFISGMRIGGDLIKVEQNTLWFKSPGIQEPLSASLNALQSLVILNQNSDAPPLASREGRLELAGAVLHGCLTNGRDADPGDLWWQPVYSTVASRLARGIAGRIIYRDPPPPPKPQPARQVVANRVVAGNLVVRKPREPEATVSANSKSKQVTPILHMRSGDTIPCMVSRIDEKGITFETALTETTFVRHDQVKALELMPDAAAAKITKPKKERLLTLPRMQRDNPPTHLIRSIRGDYLRGRLVEMDDKQLVVEVRLETRTLPREGVARMIWLHADEVESVSPPAIASTDHPPGTRVQAIPSDGNRLTFFADQLAGSMLSGRSELLGNCRVDLGQIDQILINAAIEQATATLAFHQWKLKPAADPLEALSDSSGDSAEGLESTLVGKPAPTFELDLLDGKTFRLMDHKNKILVLDFWASWCGPCLQVMPQVDRVTREFADQNVELVAINLEETAERVKAALERLQLSIPVALDRDGRAAEKYGATSIPQTVIIGRDGNVERVFVGGGARFDEQLRGALKSLLSEPTGK